MVKIELKRLNPNRALSMELAIKSIDDILYEIGLCLTSQRKHPKRRLIFKPLIVLTIVSLILLKETTFLIMNENNRQYFIKLRSFGYLLNKNKIFDVIFILADILTIYS